MTDIEQLQVENKNLKEVNALKSEWISISAHQLRTSLSANKWMLKMFLDKDFGDMTTEQEGFLKKAFDANQRMLALVNEMLSINHMEDRTLSYSFSDGDMIELIEDITFDFYGESFKKGVQLIFLKPESGSYTIHMDIEKIRVVCQNLIENAIKYSNKGDKIIISMKDENETLTVSVKDTGIGIPENEKESIFKKFFRATNAQHKEEIGSGLGLYTTRAIVEKHGGTIWFESGKEHGTTFFFSLPKKAPQLNG